MIADMRRLLPLLVAALAVVASGCAGLPPLEGRAKTTAFADTAGTRLGLAAAPGIAVHPGSTGVHPLAEPRLAFAARILLASEAQRSIDAQYYIWHGDQAGMLLFEALWRAAERGVRVRLLLDDLNTGGLDPVLAALDSHANIEVRLYNPIPQRGARGLAFLADFGRLNRRMHNKSFTVDGQVTIVGGRNVGNEYFAVGGGLAFADLDVVAVGAAVREVSAQFDLYWNSPSAYPSAALLGPPPDDLATRFEAARADPESVAYGEAVRGTPVVRDLLAGKLALEWTRARLVHDDPAKTLDTQTRRDVLLFPELVRVMGRPEETFDLVSPYFVPGDDGTEALAALAQRGTRVRVLTNSLASSEANVVHSGYAKRRQALLRAGVRLYEIKPSAGADATSPIARAGSSAPSALHAKTFAVDRSRIFVGSFNFDLRSALLNTELGLVIDSPALAQRLAALFDRSVVENAWEVRLRADGEGLEWIERTGSGELRHRTEPGAGWWRRFAVELLSALPIDWLL